LDLEEIIDELEALSTPENIEGMARFGITPEKTFAVRIPDLRKIAKKAGKDHALAEKLWERDYRETKILACMIEEPELVSSAQMDSWVLEFDYWEICDQCCMNLFRKTAFAYNKIYEWSEREEEFVKRAAFTLIAVMAGHDKKAHDEQFEKFFPLIIRESTDNRNFVKKAVNWALRHIGKRNIHLNKCAIEVAMKIKSLDSKSSRWIASDALRELKSEKIQNRLLINTKDV
jgi:3-methyladenine DNA glycosylase AlkD